MPRTSRDVATALLLALAGVLAAAGPAAAHGQLAEAEPADGSAVAAPLEQVTLWFTELPSRDATFVVTAPDGTPVQAAWRPGEPRPLREPVQEFNLVDGSWTPTTYDVGHAAVVPLTALPAAGVYRVDYESVASDGEEVKGTTSFTYRGAPTDLSGELSPAGTVAADAVFPAVPPPAPEPTATGPRPLAPAAAGPVAAEQASSDDGPPVALLVALAVVVAVVANVALLARRRSRAAATPPVPPARVSPRTGGARSRRR